MFSKKAPDNASSGSEISSEDESIAEQIIETEELSGLEANCYIYRHPATPPASPEPSTPAVQNSNQGYERRLPRGLARALENALKDATPADSYYHSSVAIG